MNVRAVEFAASLGLLTALLGMGAIAVSLAPLTIAAGAVIAGLLVRRVARASVDLPPMTGTAEPRWHRRRTSGGRPMRVLAIHPSPDLYGADLMLVKSLEALQRGGHQVRLLVPEDGPLLPVLADRKIAATITPFPVLRKAMLRPRGVLALVAGLPRVTREVRRQLAAFTPDVIYVNTITIPHWVLLPKLLRRARVVCHVRELEERAPGWLSSVLAAPLLAADVILANSGATAAFLTRKWPALAPRTRVVYNGFDLVELPSRSALPPVPARIACVGRLGPRKGQDLLIEAFAQVIDDGFDAELDIIGTTFRGYEWYERRLRERVDHLVLSDRVHFRGYVASAVAAFAEAHVAVVPSRLEPFGNVAVEALLAGCPVIAARVGGLAEIVTDGRTGLLVAPDDAEELAAAIATLLRDRDTAEDMGARGRAEARRRFARSRYDRELTMALESVGR